MKYAREIKVGLLAIICGGLLFYGLFFLKGVNIFSSTYAYHGVYTHVDGLAEQAPVLVRGYKVGQVDHIRYDFTKDSAFTIDISVDKDIQVPIGTCMRLVPNGLLGGTAIELQIPTNQSVISVHQPDDYLPTDVVSGLVEQLQEGVMDDLQQTVVQAQQLLTNLNNQLGDDYIKSSLAHIDHISADMEVSSAELKQLMQHKIPTIVDNVDQTMISLNKISSDLNEADLKVTIAKVDTAITQVNAVLAEAQTTDGTLGKLINDAALYNHINATIISADSLLTDLKANPKRYVHFSLFGAKDKSKNKTK